MSFWVIIDDSVAADELLAGAGAAAIGAFLAELAGHQAQARIRMRAEWVVPALRLPAALIRETFIVFGAVIKCILRGEQPPSGFSEIPVRYGAETPADRTRRSLRVGGSSVAPNRFVLGIDPERDVMVIHQLVIKDEEPGG